MCFGSLLGGFWVALGVPGGRPEGLLAVHWGLLGVSWGSLGWPLRLLEGLLGVLRVSGESLWGVLGAFLGRASGAAVPT